MRMNATCACRRADTSVLNRFEMHAHAHRQTVAMTWREVCAPRLRAPHSRSKTSAAAFLPPASSLCAASGDTAGGTKAAARSHRIAAALCHRIAAALCRALCRRGTPSLEGIGARRRARELKAADARCAASSSSCRTSIPPRMSTAATPLQLFSYWLLVGKRRVSSESRPGSFSSES